MIRMKCRRLDTIFILLWVTDALSVTFANQGDLGVLISINQEPSRILGEKDSDPAVFSPTRGPLPSPQQNLQPAAEVKNQDGTHVYSKDTESSAILQTQDSNGREGSHQDLTDARKSSPLGAKNSSNAATYLGVLDSLPGHGDSVVEDTKSRNDEQSQPGLQVSGSFGDFKIGQPEQSGKFPEPDRPDAEETTGLDISFKNEEEIGNDMFDNSTVLLDSVSEESSNKSAQYDTDEYKEDSGSYGNPPVLLDSNEVRIMEKISNLSPEEREQLRTEISESLGLSPIDPGLALLPREQNLQTLAPKRTNEPNSETTYPTTTTTTTTETLSSNFFQKDNFLKGSALLNAINNIVKTDSAEKTQVHNNDVSNIKSGDDVNDFKVAADKYISRENPGRKVLNKENAENYPKPEDEYELNIDRYFYQYYDEDEDDYVGGEVVGTVSPKDKMPLMTVNQTETSAQIKLGMTEDNVGNPGEARENQQAGSEKGAEDGDINIDQTFSYDDSDWYYDPEDNPDSEVTLNRMVSTSTWRHENDIPSPDKGHAADGKPSEPEKEVKVPEVKEGVVNKEDLHTKKALQAPKGTIVLYTAVIVVLIACFVVFSMWKNPFKNGRPMQPLTTVRAGEEGKRLLDHPFV